MKDKTCVLVTGGFDPLHEGHLALFKHAREYGDYLFVGVNSDKWLERKKGKAFMSETTRLNIVKELSCVDNALFFDVINTTFSFSICNSFANIRTVSTH